MLMSKVVSIFIVIDNGLQKGNAHKKTSDKPFAKDFTGSFEYFL
ncbi:hypothetical protein M23134_07919 [Microscilla marina ATCC 23134]|uniref:Uncharacterized protein n=1 Tax=Microscilla marina ATCC 23134 TaxID=313606 RepID=A1ZLR8_MICM2|nr:hypothetical protein M23134_07919 [Microscilla marina ATCC 23134]